MGTLSPAVWLDDTHPVIRRGMAASLEGAGIRVEGESSRFQPSPPASGLDVLVFEAERGGVGRASSFAAEADVALVALLRRPTDALIADAINAGLAAALWFNELTPASFVATVWGVVQGTVTLSPQLAPRVFGRAGDGHPASDRRPGEPASRLTDRELKVLVLLAEGESTRGIAERMAFSERTVKNLVHDVLTKLNCRNRPHAVAHATREGII